MLDLVSLFNEFLLFLPEHLGTPFAEAIRLLEVSLRLFWRKLIQIILFSGIVGNNLDAKGLLRLEHVFDQSLVAVFAI